MGVTCRDRPPGKTAPRSCAASTGAPSTPPAAQAPDILPRAVELQVVAAPPLRDLLPLDLDGEVVLRRCIRDQIRRQAVRQQPLRDGRGNYRIACPAPR